jgi:putative membrane protein
VTAPAPALAAPVREWVRLHPLTPLLRGARFGLVLLAVLGQQGLRASEPLVTLGLLAVGVLLAAALGWVSWRATRYRLTDHELQVDSGVLTRRSRRVPLARLQSVDVVRPLFARLLGLAELRLEVAGGGDTEAPLQYLAEADAHRLRGQLLDLAAGRSSAAPQAGSAVPERVLVTVPTGPLVWSTVLGAPVVLLVLLLVALAAVAVVDPRAAGAFLLGAGPLVLGVGATAVRRVLAEYGFTVAESPDGLRLRHGLLETRSATIPPGRVQVVRVREPLLWRPLGWVRVEVDVAGYAGNGSEEQAATSALLPVAPRELAAALVARVLGGELPPPDRRPPSAARRRAPLQWPRLAAGLDDRHVVSTYGVLTTTLDVVPLAKVQSIRLVEGPWQRRLGLASVRLDTAGRRLPGTVLLHRDAEEARALVADLTGRARTARR